MKLLHQAILAGCATLVASAAPTQDGVTNQELSEARRTNDAVFANISTREQPVETKRSSEQSILTQSIIISDGAYWTLVPRGAVIHLPEKLSQRVNARPVGTLLAWKDFLNRNYSWISAEELTLRQAEGVHAIDPRRSEFWAKQDKVIVGVHQGGPISVHRPAATETASTP